MLKVFLRPGLSAEKLLGEDYFQKNWVSLEWIRAHRYWGIYSLAVLLYFSLCSDSYRLLRINIYAYVQTCIWYPQFGKHPHFSTSGIENKELCACTQCQSSSTGTEVCVYLASCKHLKRLSWILLKHFWPGTDELSIAEPEGAHGG